MELWVDGGRDTNPDSCVRTVFSRGAGPGTTVTVLSSKPWHHRSCIPAVKQCPPQYRPTLPCMRVLQVAILMYRLRGTMLMQVLQRPAAGRARVLSHQLVRDSNVEDARLFRDDKGRIRYRIMSRHAI